MSESTQSPAQNNAPAKQEPRSVKDFLAMPAYRGRFDEVMGKRSAQFMASITSMVTQSRQLAECDPKSVIAAAFIAATLDLPIDKNLGYAWVIPYKKVAQFQLGSKGYVQLALRSGQYSKLNACPVNAEVFVGYDEVGEPVLDWKKLDDSKPVAGYVAAWKLVNGFTKTVYWPKAKLEAHAKRFSQSYKSGYDSPWKSDFDRMGEKTVLKNALSRWGILSIDLQRAIVHDAGSQDDIDAPVKHDDGTGLFDTEAGETIESALGGTPSGDSAKSQGNAPAGQTGEAYTEAQLKGALAELENLALNLSLSETKLIEQAKALNQTVPKDAKKLAQLPYATVQKLVEWCRQYAAGS